MNNSSDSLEDQLIAVTIEVNGLQQEYDKFIADNKKREASGVGMTSARQSEGEDLLRKLNEARQREIPLLLLSLNRSSNRLETSAESLKESSNSQVKTTERLKESVDSQINITQKLLTSSRSLEILTLFLILLAFATIVVIVAQANGIRWSGQSLAFLAIGLVIVVVLVGVYMVLTERESKSDRKEGQGKSLRSALRSYRRYRRYAARAILTLSVFWFFLFALLPPPSVNGSLSLGLPGGADSRQFKSIFVQLSFVNATTVYAVANINELQLRVDNSSYVDTEIILKHYPNYTIPLQGELPLTNYFQRNSYCADASLGPFSISGSKWSVNATTRNSAGPLQPVLDQCFFYFWGNYRLSDLSLAGRIAGSFTLLPEAGESLFGFANGTSYVSITFPSTDYKLASSSFQPNSTPFGFYWNFTNLANSKLDFLGVTPVGDNIVVLEIGGFWLIAGLNLDFVFRHFEHAKNESHG